MKKISMTIKGVTPLLCNRFTDEAAMAASNGTRTSAVGEKNGTPLEQATKVLYIGSNNKPMVPGPNLFRSIMEGGRFFKNGKSKVTTQKNSLIPACLSMDEIELPIKHVQPWKVDTRPVRIPATGGRILKHRPCFDDWELSCTLELDTDIMSENLLREIIDAAGKRIGLCDYRPDTKGPFGKFVVTKWTIQDN